jgi:apolipoprotein D and lipocalin family protein
VRIFHAAWTGIGRALAPFTLLVLAGCTGIPEGISPVTDFRVNDYLGTWYEIARLDHSFERGLQRVSAEYSLQDDGSLRVVNRGYSSEEQEWKEVIGKARFVRSEQEGYLKVSFFGPFYGSYIIFYIDPDYQHAFVTGYDKSYLWLLARTPEVDAQVINEFRKRSQALGFDVDGLIFPGNG